MNGFDKFFMTLITLGIIGLSIMAFGFLVPISYQNAQIVSIKQYHSNEWGVGNVTLAEAILSNGRIIYGAVDCSYFNVGSNFSVGLTLFDKVIPSMPYGCNWQ